MKDNDTSYNTLPYLVRAYVQSSPDRLATIAALHGLAAPPITGCRVLELGCAAGGNIIPLAQTLPGSTFVGVDFAATQIAEGNRVIEQLGLRNIRLEHASILDIDAGWGTFDYIIVHGVYSWVPANVRTAIMQVIVRHLSPKGVAYISYNTFPGWSVLRTVRDALLLRTRGITDVRRRAATARNLLEFLAVAEGDYTVFPERPVKIAAQFFKEKVDALGADGDAYLVHELLEEINEPFYFEQFVEQAEQHELQYLSEAELADSLTTAFPPAVAEALDAASDTAVERGQYMDFLRDQTFRQSLLCHDNVALEAEVWPEAVFQLYVASRATCYDDADAGVTYLHDALHNDTFATEHPPTRAALAYVAGNWPRAFAFGDLVAAVESEGIEVDGEDLHILASNLLRAYSYRKELVSLHSYAPPAAAVLEERPVASPVTRLQGSLRPEVTNLYHEQVSLNELELAVLALLDGTHDCAMLREAVTVSMSDDEALDAALEQLRRSALLVASQGEEGRRALEDR